MKRSFRTFGHTVECDWSLFGLEIYRIDGTEVLRLRSFAFRGTRTFHIQDEDGQQRLVEIRVDLKPGWIRLSTKAWTAQAFVDGELVSPDLLAGRRRQLLFVSLAVSLLIAVVGGGLMGLLFGVLSLLLSR